MTQATEAELEKEINRILAACRLAALSTCDGKSPHASLVGFVHHPESASIIFATPSSGKKYGNLKKLPNAALLISETAGTDNNFFGSAALTAAGECEEIGNKEEVIPCYIKKFPGLEAFARDSKTAFFRLKVRSFYLVRNFQEVSELHVR